MKLKKSLLLTVVCESGSLFGKFALGGINDIDFEFTWNEQRRKSIVKIAQYIVYCLKLV